MSLAIINPPRIAVSPEYELGKRLMDLAICLAILPIVLPIIAICMLAIRLDSPGPVLFSQERVGRAEKRFKMYKLRTIYHDIDTKNHREFMREFVRQSYRGTSSQPSIDHVFDKSFDLGMSKTPTTTAVNKPIEKWQVTKVGRVLRKTSLDELPQIVNVLRGEMSIVGPRPNVPWEVQECQPWHYERLEVLPGITGLAQIRGRSCITFDQIARADIEYVQKRSLGLDVKILYWTFRSVVSRQGAE